LARRSFAPVAPGGDKVPTSRKHDGNLWGVRHGAHSSTALVPRVTGIKRSLLARMGLRQSELSWIAREQLDLYCRSRAKLLAIDRWLEQNPMIDTDGNPAGCMKLYLASVNSTLRALESLRVTVGDLARTDDRYETALAALEREAA
jgi:hypothetical protein